MAIYGSWIDLNPVEMEDGIMRKV